MSFWENLKEEAARYIYPRKCPLCGRLLGRAERICASCSDDLVQIEQPICRRCGRAVFSCDCVFYELKFERSISLFVHTKSARRGVHRLKDYGDFETASYFGKRMAHIVREEYADYKIDMVIGVPMTDGKFRTRGFNQAAMLARIVAAELSLPVRNGILIKHRNNSTQHSLGRAERKDNVAGVFKISNRASVAGMTILLCDDVMTTGYTLSECAGVLLGAGAKRVLCVTATSTDLEMVSNAKRAMLR
ncbi:MAG: ComF family protein [Oscillospiraceae bacterium]|jgi:ComF family protein|nr:ComF family protein [Oscillospiraceae bacterium]